MASLDYIRDIADTLKSQGINYLIITAQKKKGKEVRLDFFQAFEDKQDAEALRIGMQKMLSQLEEYIKNGE